MNQGTVPHVFFHTAKKYSHEPSMRKKHLGLWRDITWDEYYRSAKYIGAALISMGLKKGECASLIGDNCPEWVIIDLGIQCIGGVSVGIYSTNPWSQVEYVIKNSDSRFLFVENEEQLEKWLRFRNKAPLLKKIIIWNTRGLKKNRDPMIMTYDDLLELGSRVQAEKPDIFEKRMSEVQPEDLSVLIYTSGTTGPPKGAMLCHRNVTWMGSAVQSVISVDSTDETLSFLPLCHIFERVFSVFAHITHGFKVNFVERPDTITDNMREISPTVCIGVPRIWEKYLSGILIRMSDATRFKKMVFSLALRIGKQRTTRIMNFRPVPAYLNIKFGIAYLAVFRKLKERLGFDRLRVAVSGGAPISPGVLHFFQSIGVNLIEGYGQTEGTAVTCSSRPGKTLKFGKVGTPLAGVEVKISDDGEILVKSPSVFKGYYKDPDSTSKALKGGWLCSGDIGELDEDGYLKITDRKKDIIVTAGGKNIAPQYIENQLKFSPYINDAVIIGENRKFITSLILVDEDNVVKYAQDNKIQFSTYKDLARNPHIIQLIKKEVDEVNKGLSQAERIKKFTILPKKLYEEDGEVTPTMKIKRKYMNENFRDLIEEMYKTKP